MKNVLNYQTCEYDCGPVSLLNGIRYLFDREEIYPDIVKFIMLYCMDTYNEHGELCKQGTSSAAMSYITNWLNHFSETRHFPIHCDYIKGKEVVLAPGSPIWTALENGAAVVLRVNLECWHYVLLTGLAGEQVRLFDPYYRAQPFEDPALRMVADCPDVCNRIVPAGYLERQTRDAYAFGPVEEREAVLLFNERTVLTADRTVEYMI